MHRRSSLLARCLRVLEGGLVLTSLILLVFVVVLAIETWRTPWRDPNHAVRWSASFAYFAKNQDQGTFEAGCFIRAEVEPEIKRLWQPRLGPLALGFSYGRGYVAAYLLMPFWLAGVLGGLGPAYVIVRLLTRRRRRACDCQVCGYDLTGNTSGVCPECGTPVKPAEG